MAKKLNRAIQISGEFIKIGTPVVRVITYDKDDQVLRCTGATKPTDGDAGYAAGCIFSLDTAVAGATVYVNEGTKASSSFKAVSSSSPIEATTADADTVTAADSGRVYIQTRSSTTVTYTLPSAAAGLEYTFVCANAGSEILITPASGDAIVTKIHAAQDGTALAPAAGTGIKNTAATNVAGDYIKLVCLDGTTWYGIGMTGLWASQ